MRKLTSATAEVFGLSDRGRLVPGKKADLNVIDFDELGLERPTLVSDLPGGAKRLDPAKQRLSGDHQRGQVTLENGEDTGARPGCLVRGAR